MGVPNAIAVRRGIVQAVWKRVPEAGECLVDLSTSLSTVAARGGGD